ncbi:hypothetical protein LLB_3270 [Legionella longbeachae D-4968]|nr:hypothetical protein LLB_3270 [Legionella longbeachae D-4968]
MGYVQFEKESSFQILKNLLEHKAGPNIYKDAPLYGLL